MTTAGQLTEDEQRIVAAAKAGKPIDLRVGDGFRWGIVKTIRAELLIELLTAKPTADIDGIKTVNLRGVRITGHLNLEARALSCPLLLRDCRLEHPVDLDDVTASTIRLRRCHYPGFSAEQLRTSGNLELREIVSKGETNLSGAHIGGQLILGGARLVKTSDVALNAQGLVVEQSLSGEGLIAEGQVWLMGAHIGGAVNLRDAHISNPGAGALTADGVTVERSMNCDGLTVEGEFGLIGARIGGLLSLAHVQLGNLGGYALNADALIAEKGMYCNQEFSAEGEVCLVGARVGGQLALIGAHLKNPGRFALNAERLVVDQEMLCLGLVAEGKINMSLASVGGVLSFGRAKLDGSDGLALRLRSANVAELMLTPADPPNGEIDLTNARVGAFYDDQETWPLSLRVRGFIYDTLENDQVSVPDRLRWLTLHPDGYIPQPYDQLATVYRRAGQSEAARKVGVAKQWRRRSVYNPFNWLLYLTIGYGYRTWQAAIWLAAFTLIGSVLFTLAHPHMTQATPTPPAFHALPYTLDVLVPVVDLGQEKAWIPQGWAQDCSWFLIIAGWFLTTAVVAGLTGIFKRD